MNRYYLAFLAVAGLFTFAEPVSIAHGAEAASRISGEINDQRTFHLTGNIKPMLALAQDQGEVAGSRALPRLAIHFTMSAQQREDLDQLIRQQQIPGAAQYHRFLTPEEYGERFGLNPSDLAKVRNWLQNSGFTNIEVGRSRNFVSFSGSAANVQNTFQTKLHRYAVNGEDHYANTGDPVLPKALSGLVENIRGLNNFRMRPQGIRKVRPNFTSSISGNHYLAPGDLATIYNINPLYQSGLDGSGVKIAVVGQSDIQLSDVRAFRAAAGLSPNDPTIVLTGTDPGLQFSSGDETESDLDVEWAGAIARNASVVFVTSPDVATSITYAIDNNVAPVLSVSYGLCESELGSAESATQASQYLQANAQGITVVAAAGDSGPSDCDTSYPARLGPAVDVPASLPYVTGIGGTALNDSSGSYWGSTNDNFGASALSYIPEVVWNDSSLANGLSASGGGASIFNAKPAWQMGTGVPSDGSRDVPDLAFVASPSHDGLLICSNGDCVNGFRDTDTTLDVIGGTSSGAPTFAGIVALMVQAMGPQGNINPTLYSLASTSTDAFHDVTSGNNKVACRSGSPNCTSGTLGFSAGVGYDQATGLGSVDAYHLVQEWRGATATSTNGSSGPLLFVPLTPCRVVDTRGSTGQFGGPELYAAATREFDIPSSTCNIPPTAVAYVLNVTVVPGVPLGYLTVWPSGQARPLVSTLNSDGRIKANAAIVPAGANGGVSVFATNPTHLVMDISGYFVPAASASGLQFYALPPCRIADTRGTDGNSGGPSLTGGRNRDFAVLSSGCNVPTSAQAYSLNFTVVPKQPIDFFVSWPTGQAQPLASVLNSPTGSVTANAAIIPAGSGGSISTYSTNDTDLVIDIDGYFGPPGSGGSYFYAVSPCRALDTRNPAGTMPFSGTITANIPLSGCQAPASAQAYALNATVVPSGALTYLTLWPQGQSIPLVSSLNADPNTVTSNMAIVPATNGLVNAYAAGTTHLVLDVAGYFAP